MREVTEVTYVCNVGDFVYFVEGEFQTDNKLRKFQIK